MVCIDFISTALSHTEVIANSSLRIRYYLKEKNGYLHKMMIFPCIKKVVDLKCLSVVKKTTLKGEEQFYFSLYNYTSK